ncbi:MAG: DNA-directed RNA polymerases II 24 kDa polypeptide (RNA polymerase II subunit 5) [Bathelium mastoideum]|nr:MAG: DNA-directed RNA polymerases II 24 kDa polypeptide (RNA polymerase II subunit 5) [Bathelium mastoideum]KAI9688771.1 MAG: DNA-directed RNA polymerases II 24 kDa polypeptide (RNA polymerase II subunit 5) [Bathelium mastoideum]
MAEERGEEAKEVYRMYRVWRTTRQMLKDRGYELLEEEIEIPFEEFKRRNTTEQGVLSRGNMAFSAKPSQEMIEKYREPASKTKPASDNIGTVWVEFNGDPNVGIKQLRTFVHTIASHNFYTGIFVSKSAVTGAALKVIPTILPQIVEVFDESDLLVNITKHELVPKHVLLSPDEKKALLQRYRLKETQLPRIQKDDPVARYLGLRRGQVVKIIRRSETAGRYASYRWCI